MPRLGQYVLYTPNLRTLAASMDVNKLDALVSAYLI